MNIYVESLDDSHQGPINGNLFNTNSDALPNVQEEQDQDSSSDWANSARTSQLDSSDESTLENTIEDLSVMLPEMSRFVTTF